MRSSPTSGALGSDPLGQASATGEPLASRRRSWVSACWIGAAVSCVLVIAGVSWAKPQLNWDMLAYVAIVDSWNGAAPVDAHAAAYADAGQFAAGRGLDAAMAALREGFYRQTVAADAEAFEEQLPFYRIRPLYLLVVAACAKLTGTVSAATVLVSVLSVASFSLGLLWYAVRTLGAVPGSVLGGLFALAPTTTDVASLSSPDALLMLLTGVAAMLFMGSRPLFAASLLSLGVLVRTELVVFDICLAAAWTAVAWRQPRSGMVAAILAGSVLPVAAVNAWAGNYGYTVLYRFTFVDRFVPHPARLLGESIPAMSFLHNIVFGVRYSLGNGGLWIALALLGLCGVLAGRAAQSGRWRFPGDTWRSGRSRTAIQALLLAVGGQTCVRFVLFPAHDVRLFAPSVGILAVTLVALSADRSPDRTRQPGLG
jgi:hypothetical protein